jgi:hypothetical protein
MALPLGLHFGLPAEQHHADPGLGSSAIKQLAENPFDYWFYSAMNKDRAEEEDDNTASLIVGTALHCFLYDGERAFSARYARGPNQRGMTTSQKSASTKKAKEQAAAQGRECLKADIYDRIVLAHQMITRNPATATVFADGIPEVTFIWNDPKTGIRCKARFDYIKTVQKQNLPGRLIAIGDLKSVANLFSIEFKAACRQAIKRYKYHAQARHYLNGAALIPAAIKASKVHSHSNQQINVVETLKNEDSYLACLAAARHVGWQWIFHQTSGAPLTFSYYLSPGNEWWERGQVIIDQAFATYQDCMAKYGRDKEWLMIEPPEELPAEEMGWRP